MKSIAREGVFNEKTGLSAFITNNRKAIIIYTVCILAAYGLKLFNIVLGKDTEAIISIPDSLYNSWISLDRFGLVYFKKLLGIYQFNPYLAMTLMVICVIVGSVIWEYLFYRLTPYKKDFHKRSWIFPAVCFTSPLMASQLGFLLQTFEVALGFIFVSLSLLLIWQFMDKGKILYAVLSLILLSAALSFYQGLAPLYVAGAAGTFLLYAEGHSKVLKPVLILIINLVIALLIYKAVDSFVHVYTGVASDPYIGDIILWKSESAGVCIGNILGHIKHALTMSNSYYTLAFPFAAVCGLLLIIRAFRKFDKNRVIYFLAMIIFIASPFIMSVYTGQEAYYRTQFVMPFVCGLAIQMFTGAAASAKFKWYAAVTIISMLVAAACIFQQVVVTTRMYYTEYESYKEDEMLALKLSMRIDELGLGESPEEPLMIVGGHQGKLNPSASNEWEFEGRSFFNWYYGYAEGNAIAINFMRTLGLDYHVPDPDQVARSVENAGEMPLWPNPGSVALKDGVIVVHMS